MKFIPTLGTVAKAAGLGIITVALLSGVAMAEDAAPAAAAAAASGSGKGLAVG